MRRQACAALLAALVACGQPSDVAPNATVTVTGSALHADGSPLADASVVVTTEIGPDELAADAPLFFGTAGLVCFTPADLDVCDEHGIRTEADQRGRFSVELRGADVQSGFGTVSTLWASIAAPHDPSAGQPPATSYAFTAVDKQVRLPALSLWEPKVDLKQPAGDVTVTVPELPTRYGRTPRYATHFVDDTGAAAWTLARRGGRIDARVLEDLQGSVAVEASLARGPGELDGAVVYRSGSVAFVGPGAPPSRGAACSAVATGREHVEYEPCPLTDGDVGESFDPALDPKCPDGDGCPHWDTTVIVDLGRSRDISLLVLRADDDSYLLSASDDAAQWQRVGVARVTEGQALVTPTPRLRARYVRLAAQRWPLSTLRELSVW